MDRDALDAFGEQIAGRRLADVAQTEDADHPLALVDHWQPADLQRLHVPHRLGEVIVLPAAMDAWSHHIARRRAAGIEAVLRQPLRCRGQSPCRSAGRSLQSEWRLYHAYTSISRGR